MQDIRRKASFYVHVSWESGKVIVNLNCVTGTSARYGKPAAAALSGRRLKTSEATVVLSEERKLTDHFFELVMETERNALKRRFL